MNSPERRLRELLDGILDATCTDSQWREFAALVEEHPELAKPLVEQLRTHSLLQWHCDELKVGNLLELRKEIEEFTGLHASRGPSRRFKLGWIATLAATLVIAGGAISWWSTRETPAHGVAVAEVVAEDRVVWSDNSTGLINGKSIRPGRLEIESGSLTVRFRSGATVVFSGAASMNIESDMLVRLDRGQATAQVPQWARGFTIETADAEIIDLGTEFGVMAHEEGMTDVVIFEGEVDVKPLAGNRRVQKRLNQGEAARINKVGVINRIVEVRGDAGGGWSTEGHSAFGGSVFKAIRDNIPPSDGSKYYYYQITHGGLEEDASAYVDRHPHEWNGLTHEGIPDFLRGADYARTFNDYRYIAGFEIVVELARPANLYVFFDDRVPTPEWLKERFENTGAKIGLDEGPWEGIPDHRTAVGPGESIDNVFTVWRRRCKEGEEVTLGEVGRSREARAMYGIAATPLNETAARETNPRDLR